MACSHVKAGSAYSTAVKTLCDLGLFHEDVSDTRTQGVPNCLIRSGIGRQEGRVSKCSNWFWDHTSDVRDGGMVVVGFKKLER